MELQEQSMSLVTGRSESRNSTLVSAVRGDRTPTAREIYVDAPVLSDVEQEDLERRFFAALRLSNGTYKYTYARRLDDLNALVNELLPPARPLQLMDVAVSSGISTLEWIQSLESAGIAHTMVAGDLTVNAYLLSVGRRLHVLLDGGGHALQFDVAGKAISTPVGRVNRLRHFLALSKLESAVSIHFESLRDACADNGRDAVARGNVSCRRIALVSPRLQRALNLELIEDSILEELRPARDFHALRAANILNRSYFDDDVLRRMLSSLRQRLQSGGLFIVCRTDDEDVNSGTIFRLNEAGSFDALARIGGGTEIEDLVLALPAQEQEGEVK